MAPQPLLGDGRGGETGDAALRLRSGGGQLDVGRRRRVVVPMHTFGAKECCLFSGKSAIFALLSTLLMSPGSILLGGLDPNGCGQWNGLVGSPEMGWAGFPAWSAPYLKGCRAPLWGQESIWSFGVSEKAGNCAL